MLTLQALANAIEVEEEALIVPMLDARRMEVYSAVFSHNYRQIRGTQAEIIDASSFEDYLNKARVYFLGDGADKVQRSDQA